MHNLKRIIIKTSKIIAAEGFFVFFRKAVRRLYWELASKYLHRVYAGNITYRQSMNEITRRLLVKQLPASLMDQNARALFDLIEGFKEEIIEIGQKKKSCDQKWKESL